MKISINEIGNRPYISLELQNADNYRGKEDYVAVLPFQEDQIYFDNDRNDIVYVIFDENADIINIDFGSIAIENKNNIVKIGGDLKFIKTNLYLYNLCNLKEFSVANVVIESRVMFKGCKSLITIPQLDTSKVIYMSDMFSGCVSLKTIPQLDTSNVTNMERMFYNCISLEKIPQLNLLKADSLQYMFHACVSLTEFPSLIYKKDCDTKGIFNNTKFKKFEEK